VFKLQEVHLARGRTRTLVLSQAVPLFAVSWIDWLDK
jgi:hypothetical protein